MPNALTTPARPRNNRAADAAAFGGLDIGQVAARLGQKPGIVRNNLAHAIRQIEANRAATPMPAAAIEGAGR